MSDVIVLMGAQGAGKGTQAVRLAEKLAVPVISTGDILRDVAREDTNLGAQVREMQAQGRLVPDDVLARIITERAAQKDSAGGYILDGFPRTLPQARLLDEIAKAQGHKIRALNIDVPREMLWKRLTGRRQCSKCNAIYNVYFKPSKQEGVCDLDGAPLLTRSDDNEEAIAQRLALYDEKTKPLLNYYRESGRLREVEGTGDPETVFNSLMGVLRGQGSEWQKSADNS
jgi:adenylate kinase